MAYVFVIAFFVTAYLAGEFGAWVWLVALAAPFAAAALHEHQKSVAPCEHGVTGAKKKVGLCPKCSENAQEVERARRTELEKMRREAFDEWRRQVRLPEYLRSMNPQEFEHLVCSLFSQMGYEVQGTRYVADGGIDGYLRRDGRLSLLQCKRVKGSVGEPVLRDLFGTIIARKADEGIVVTTGTVSRQARKWVAEKPIRVIELPELSDLIRQHFEESEVVPSHFDPSRIAVRRSGPPAP